MQRQNFQNHTKVHPLFHYFIAPVSLVLIVVALINIIIGFSLGGLILFLTTLLLHFIAFIARQYATKNQDRIIRLEMRLRYYQLTGQSFEPVEKRLSTGQINALRFTGDDELLSTLKNEQVFFQTPVEIKKQVKRWKPDHMRV